MLTLTLALAIALALTLTLTLALALALTLASPSPYAIPNHGRPRLMLPAGCVICGIVTYTGVPRNSHFPSGRC